MNRRLGIRMFFLSFLFSAVSSLSVVWADDWPGWRGSERDDVSHEDNLLKEWPEGGPQLVWLNKSAGLGYAGFAVVDGVVYTMGTRDNTVVLIALDAATGVEKWATNFSEVFDNRWGDGPRSTPSVAGQYVYAVSAGGDLICCERKDGAVVWKRNYGEFGGEVPKWGFAGSPLVDGNKIIAVPGGPDGILVALDRLSGELLWQSDQVGDSVHYSSPIKVDVDGKSQYVQLTKSYVSGFDAATGDLLWQSDWGGRVAVIPTPIYKDGQVYVTSGYGVGCRLISIDGEQAKELYANKAMTNHHGGVILVDNHLYGYSDGKGWVCQDFSSGEIVWQEKDKFQKGAISCAGDRFYCLEEDTGEVALIEVSTEGWNEHGRFRLSPQTKQRKPAGRIWTHPVIANGRLFLRDQELIYCFDIRDDAAVGG